MSEEKNTLQEVIDILNNSYKGNVSFWGLLTILFVGLKLTSYINWSWWWVISPLLIQFGLIVAVVLITMVITIIYKVYIE